MDPAPAEPAVADDPESSRTEPPRAAPAARDRNAFGPVAASYYGPGLYGRRTACGEVLTTDLVGVAHRSLPCGTRVTLTHGETTLTVPVVDRGPFVFSREFDLTYAAKIGLGCPDICYVSWAQ